jgi:hypothetical protein
MGQMNMNPSNAPDCLDKQDTKHIQKTSQQTVKTQAAI